MDAGSQSDAGKQTRGWTTLLAVLALAIGTFGVIAIAGATQTRAANSPARTMSTVSVVVRPVTAAGHAAKGWRVSTDRGLSVSCSDAATTAVDSGIAWCSPSAAYAVACWRSATAYHVLCLGDPRRHELRSIALDGSFPKVSAPKHASPQALVLDDGSAYLIRDGGAASPLRQHPTWIDFYYSADRSMHSISGPLTSGGIDRAHARWLVTTFANYRATGVRHGVTTAYFVGTAR